MKLKSFFLCVVALLYLQVNFEVRPYPAEIEAFFLPQSQTEVYAQLSSFLDRARSRILIAMYWLTDEIVFNKLITLKKRGIDVQIIFDESTPDTSAHINAFLFNDIIPIVSPKGINGIMHNKFVVIDNNAVWTGSANFTKTVLAPDVTNFNDENIVIINSPIAAEQYSNAFYFIEKIIIEFYIQLIAQANPKDLFDWLIPLCKRLYQVNRQFKESLNIIIPHLNDFQRTMLRHLFPAEQPYGLQSPFLQEEQATPKQKAFLERRGIKSNISKKEAIELIGQIIKSETSQRYSPY